MTLVRLDQFRDLEEMSERFGRLFGRVPAQRSEGKEAITMADWTPVVDISEDPQEYVIRVELPGVRKEDVKVTVQDGVLTVQGERKQEHEEKGKRFHRIERIYGTFVRSFTVPDDADEAKVAAEFRDGMLNIHLPKTEKAKPKSIDVKVG